MALISMIDIGSTEGRAQYAASDGSLYVSRGYRIYRSSGPAASWELDCFIPDAGWKRFPGRFALGQRLLRRYVQAFQAAEDGSRTAVARDGVYVARPGETRMERTFEVLRGSRPINFCMDGRRILFGEYGDDLQNPGPRLYLSEDGGRRFEVAYTFATGEIRHVHNIVLDPFRGHYWVLTGDFEAQPGIGILSRDGKNFEWLVRGKQVFRAVSVLVDEEYLTYGTDSSTETNCIGRLHKKTGRFEKLLDVEGSSLYAARCGGAYMISTCVEPNPAAPTRTSSLYASRDGVDWTSVATYRKDALEPILFQFGTLVLPCAGPDGTTAFFSGQALSGFHGRCRVVRFNSA